MFLFVWFSLRNDEILIFWSFNSFLLVLLSNFKKSFLNSHVFHFIFLSLIHMIMTLHSYDSSFVDDSFSILLSKICSPFSSHCFNNHSFRFHLFFDHYSIFTLILYCRFILIVLSNIFISFSEWVLFSSCFVVRLFSFKVKTNVMSLSKNRVLLY